MTDRGSPAEPTSETHRFVAGPGTSGRLDIFVAANVRDLSRGAARRLIDEGRVRLNGRAMKASALVEPGDIVEIEVPPVRASEVQPEPIPLVIVYEDADL